MARRSEIETKIDTELASGQAGGITAAQHRSVLGPAANSVLSELYRTTSIIVSQGSTNILTRNTTYSDVDYTMYFKKQGGVVYVNGTITNTGGNTYTNITLATVTDTEYQSPITMKLPSFTENTASIGQPSDSEVISLSIDNSDNFKILDTLPANGTLYINTFYFVGG